MTRALFGADNPNAPLYVVMLGGLCLLAASACMGLVEDVRTPVVSSSPGRFSPGVASDGG
jgi:hypothetical protein